MKMEIRGLSGHTDTSTYNLFEKDQLKREQILTPQIMEEGDLDPKINVLGV